MDFYLDLVAKEDSREQHWLRDAFRLIGNCCALDLGTSPNFGQNTQLPASFAHYVLSQFLSYRPVIRLADIKLRPKSGTSSCQARYVLTDQEAKRRDRSDSARCRAEQFVS